MTELRDRLRHLVGPGRDIEWVWDDPVFGMPKCHVGTCVRGVGADGSNLCEEHGLRWKAMWRCGAGERPDLDAWDGGPPVGPTVINLSGLPEQLRLELKYGVQRARERLIGLGLTVRQLRLMVHQLGKCQVKSLLQHPEWAWPQPGGKPPGQLRNKLILLTIDELEALLGSSGRDCEVTRDRWRMRRLGIDDTTGIGLLRFDTIDQPWLRAAIKNFIIWRLDCNRSPNGLRSDLDALVGLASTLTQVAGESADATSLTTELVDRFLDSVKRSCRNRLLTSTVPSVAAFLSYLHKNGLAPGLAASVTTSNQIFARTRKSVEHVLSQLGSPSNLDKLPDRRWRLLLHIVLHARLQLDDALSLEVDCGFRNAAGKPHLRYFDRGQGCQTAVGISDELYQAVIAVCDEVAPPPSAGPCLLFRDVAAPADTVIVGAVLRQWLSDCEVFDEEGHPIEFSVARLRYAIRSQAILAAERIEPDDGPVVDVGGKTLVWQPLAESAGELPNGYCRLSIERRCPHPHACLTCGHFATTRKFLPLHREQLSHTERMIKRGVQRGEERLVETNQQVLVNLSNIITALRAR